MALFKQPRLKPEIQTLYGSDNDLDTSLAIAKSRLPITSDNELMGVLMPYHNTLLKMIQQENATDEN